jgi:hypothetical protein
MTDNAFKSVLVRINRIRFSPDASLWSRTTTMAFQVGVMFGIFDLLIVGVAVFGGRYQSCSRSGRDICDMYLLAVTYPLGTMAMGAIFGACYPLCRRRWLAMLVGTAAVIPWFTSIAVTDVKTRAGSTGPNFWIVGICSLAIGPYVGYQIWKRMRSRRIAAATASG